MSEPLERSSVTVLLVDDEENILRSLERLFLDEEFTVITASSGEEGIRALQGAEHVAVIVSDQRMPGMTGAEFLAACEKLKALGLTTPPGDGGPGPADARVVVARRGTERGEERPERGERLAVARDHRALTSSYVDRRGAVRACGRPLVRTGRPRLRLDR